MKLNSACFITAILLAGVFAGCKPKADDPQPDTPLVQYLKFKVNGQPVDLIINDSIVFESGGTGLQENSSVPDTVFFVQSVTARIEHKISTTASIFESTILQFRNRYPRSAVFYDPNFNNRYSVRPEVFESLFAPGDWTWYRHACQDSIRLV